jgi:hypothetical protein
MKETLIPVADCNKIFDILLEAKANENDRDSFIYHFSEQGCREFRFGGVLGFGGKFYNYLDRWYISCYPEDRTPEAARVIENINKKLRALQES